MSRMLRWLPRMLSAGRIRWSRETISKRLVLLVCAVPSLKWMRNWCVVGKTRIIGLGLSIVVVHRCVDGIINRYTSGLVDGIVEGAATILGTVGRFPLIVWCALLDPIEFCRRLEICEEVVGAHEWDILREEDPVFVVVSLGRCLLLAITEAAVVEAGLESRIRRRLKIAWR
jgi:hypothetical protein